MTRIPVGIAMGLVLLAFCGSAAAQKSAAPLTLDDVVTGRAKLVDLTYVLNDHSPYWPGENYQPFKLVTIATLERDGVLSKAVSFPEHLGTHLDAPNHFEANRPSVDQIKPEQLFAPGVVIDIAMQAEANADYALTHEDVTAWEAEHGAIPDGAVVLIHTGWGRFWTNYDRYKNQDVRGGLHFPGCSKAAAEFLVTERMVRGLGIDTLSIDPGVSKTFDVHHVLNGAGRYALENVAHLDELPAKGFYLVVAPIKIEDGTGGPARIFAIAPHD
jgi:kynurenine formamidase